ncbi:MAG: carbamoyl-phosphate synthase (glutamine-hydrolyzing) large subunit [Candidatus Walczuchella monophlebidarum]
MKKILVIGSGALKIGEAGEFDYSGTQALKAIKEEGIETILVNPNIATVQTSEGIADKIYFLPISHKFIKKVIEKEKPSGLLLSFGGQTALNCGVQLFEKGVLKKHVIKVLGTPIESIIASEDRDLFRDKLNTMNIKTARGIVVHSLEEAFSASEEIGFPLIIRTSYALGGLSSGFAHDKKELATLIDIALSHSSQILIEESLKGWKEIEYEVMCDRYGNCITVCNMENFDPIGIHTGDSIVVAPSQTLTNSEYQKLRTFSLSIARAFGIIGECNVQFALSPNSEDYRLIEINARLSRSSALASKATGYPIAFIAAKLALGYGLHELKNYVTQTTSAFFEPSLDYVVCKFPRWDLKKFYRSDKKIDSSMKSVGEVMSIGGSFEEAFQKGLRMLDIGLEGFINPKKKSLYDTLEKRLIIPTDHRVEALEDAFDEGYTAEKLYDLTRIDLWFLYKLRNIHNTKKILSRYKKSEDLPKNIFYLAKKQGYSDRQIGAILSPDVHMSISSSMVRNRRKTLKIFPNVRRIDTLSAEYPAYTNYLYMSYHAYRHDIDSEGDGRSVVVLGSGVYRIGSSVEFDWCCVNTLKVLHSEGYRSIMINCNPETVSTDFDECDRLYFEELTLERVLDILELETPKGTIVSMGGQISNNLALPLHKNKQRILGSLATSIDEVEDRYKFSKALDILGIEQPMWKEFSNLNDIHPFIREVGYPILIRPSYVLSGSGMNVIFNVEELRYFFEETISSEHSVVISKFIENAKEIELDAVAHQGSLIYHAVSEHIEFAGLHSGDATLVYPPQNIYFSTLQEIERISKKIARYFHISGPFNIQFISINNRIKVIECNLRASRSFPFISKVSGFNLIRLATEVMLGKLPNPCGIFFSFNYIGVKVSYFSFSRIPGTDPVLGVDMVSTGEVGCLGKNFHEALIKAMLAAGYSIPIKHLLISGEISSLKEYLDFINTIKLLVYKGYKLFSTEDIYPFLMDYGLTTKLLYWPGVHHLPNVFDYIRKKKIDFIINIPKNKYSEIDNNYTIRRSAVDFNIPLLTNTSLAKAFIVAFCKEEPEELTIAEWKSYMKRFFSVQDIPNVPVLVKEALSLKKAPYIELVKKK